MEYRNKANRSAPHVCPYWRAFALDNWIRKLIQSPRKILEPYIRAGDTVIDLGCGPGFFTNEMARLVGPFGKVVAVDLQSKMLAQMHRKAGKQGLKERITPHQCEADRINLECKADFILAYYMVHETPDPKNFFAQVKALLKLDGRLLVVEPRIHVSRKMFNHFVEITRSLGLKTVDFPKGKGGYSVLVAL